MIALTTPGRICFPDGEIAFQTSEALLSRGSWSVDGIPYRTGEPRHRPDGSFGVDGAAPDGRRYGFFGQALPVAALPLVALGKWSSGRARAPWHRAARRDVFIYHQRSPHADWLRLLASFTNVWICALLAWVTARWARAIGFGWRPALIGGLASVLCTFMWSYGATFMSEPLSALLLVGCAAGSARWGAGEGGTHLHVAALLGGLAVHAHVLNLLALPLLLGYAIALHRRAGGDTEARRLRARQILLATGIGLACAALLLLSQALRFGHPLETGRFGHYAHFVPPWPALAAFLLAPGRALLLFAPAVALGLAGVPALRRRAPLELWLVVGLVALRAALVATRSDWYGGWTLGPRYLAPLVPFACLPLIAWLDELERPGVSKRWPRTLLLAALLVCGGVCGWLAAHTNSEHMWALMQRHGVPEFYARSHWDWSASPFAGFARLDAPGLHALFTQGPRAALAHNHLDIVWIGAYRLHMAGHPGMWRVALALAGFAALAAWRLWVHLGRLPRDTPGPATAPTSGPTPALSRVGERE